MYSIFMRLGHNDPWVESHMWPQQPWGQRSSRGQWPFLTLTGMGSNLVLQWLHKYVITKAGETRGSPCWKKVHCIHIRWCIFMGLGYNDPWVESHMWPQQTWGQRSSRGQWPLVQVFAGIGSNLILQWLQKYVITKAGETCGSRTALYECCTFFWYVASILCDGILEDIVHCRNIIM